jgi:ParG
MRILITVDFEDDLHLRLKIQCAKKGIHITDLIRRLAAEYVKKVKKKPKR